jgi:DnaA family protein
MHPQMTLALDTAPATSFRSFHIDIDTAVVRDTVQAFAEGALSDVQIYLWGDTGTGKSHLISAACQAFSHRGYRIAYVPGEMVNHRGALDGMEHVDLLCIDDVQRIDRASEVDLFHCINRCRELDTRLIIASDRAPSELGLRLKDLQTRLAWGLVFQMRYLSDDGLKDAFRHEIENRSLEVSDEVLGYVFRRFPRRMSVLKQLVNTLDEISLSEQRRITIPFIKTVFGEAERIALSEQVR